MTTGSSSALFPGRTALRLRHRRAARKLFEISIADVAQIGDADLAGEETVGGKLAKKSEEFNALPQAGIFLRVLTVGDLVENFILLIRCAIEIDLAIAIEAVVVEPHHSSAESELIILVLACDQVDEFGSAGLDGSFGVSVGRNDRLAERLQGLIEMRREELGRIDLVFRRGLFFAHHAMRVFSGFERNHTQDRAGDGGYGERFQNVSARDGHSRSPFDACRPLKRTEFVLSRQPGTHVPGY